MDTFGAARALLDRADRNDGPALLWMLHLQGRLPSSAARPLVAEVWCACDLPQNALTQSDWRELFTLAGFTIDGETAERPARAITLYRGSSRAHRRRWSWTSDRVVAERFAVNRDIAHGTEDASVWRAEVEPWRIFAINHAQRGEDEYVTDTVGLKLAEVPFGAIADIVAARAANLRVRWVGSPQRV